MLKKARKHLLQDTAPHFPNLHFSAVRPIADSDLQDCKKVSLCFKLPSSQSFVGAATG